MLVESIIMRIAKYLSDLLYEYECIVIPGFGGFICNNVPATINVNQHSFNPPSKKIVFNQHLLTNDGLLVSHIAKSENISYTDARIRVDGFVRKCKHALDRGKRIHFHKIGHIYKNSDDKLEFDPDRTQNFHADSFGMSSFISPPIKRETTLRIDKKFTDRKAKEKSAGEIKRKKEADQPRYISINIFTLLIVGAVIAIFYLNFGTVKQLYNQHASAIPFFYSTPGEYFIHNSDKLPFKEKNSSTIGEDEAVETHKPTETTKKPIVEEVISEKETEIPEKKTIDDPSKEDQGLILEDTQQEITDEPVEEKIITIPEDTEPELRYFIIAGSFEKLANANKLVDQLKQKGYNSEIIGQNKYGYYRVCFEGFADAALAEEQLAVIRREENASAWVFTK